jgi:ribosome-binding protein aMBF1 (putative translation factor)
MITGSQMRKAREALGWSRAQLATKAKVTVTVVQRAESSPGEPMVTIAHLNALMQALRTAGASFPSTASDSPDADEARL